MRKLYLLMMIVSLGFMKTYAQNVPAGMKYQAVARNTAGELLANRTITLRIELKGEPVKGSITYYSEDHQVTTNQFGLFDLVVGAGKSNSGIFAKIPWSTA